MSDLGHRLDDSQRAGVALQRCWSRLRPEDCGEDVEAWWQHLQAVPRDTLTNRERAVVEAYESAKRCRDVAEEALRPWVVRHNKARIGLAPRSSVGNVSTALPSRTTVPWAASRFRPAASPVLPGGP